MVQENILRSPEMALLNNFAGTGCADSLVFLHFHLTNIWSLYPLLYEFCYSLCLRCCYITETKAAVTDPDAEGIEYIDEGEEEENNNINRDEETKSESFNDSDGDSVEDPGALHINRVNLKSGARERERAHLRVCVEITHPALKLPVYRTWTGTQIPFSQIL